uniref:flagellar hook-basal body complex protein FliE n=1 Tax=Thaumasiovibrio occultus TaxID=1891184 RepID=UPI000B35F2AF|nr:flagellar hook-basal body complex protein FliE [Thaumasiovibrio occultus]
MKVGEMQSQMATMRLEAQSAQRPATAQQVGQDFGQMLSQAVNNVNSLQQQSSTMQTRFDQGDRTVSLSDVMIARNKSSVAFEATIEVRNKLVEAYKELMSMPV